MSVTEGIGKPIGYAIVLGGLVVAAWWFLKDFDWSSLNPFKDLDLSDLNPYKHVEQSYKDLINAILASNAIPQDPLFQNLISNPDKPTVANDIISAKTSDQWIPVETPAGSMMMTILPGPGELPQNSLKDAIEADTSGFLGGYLEPIGWVDDRDTSTKYDYPLWRDMYTGELMLGSDVNYVRSLDNLLLTDIRLGEEGRHTWWLT